MLAAVGTLTSSAAPANDITVQLTSNNTTEVSVPATIVLPAGQTSVHFDLTIGDDGLIDGTQSVLVTGHVVDWTDGSATITVYNTDAASLNGGWHTFGNGPSHTGYFSGSLAITAWRRWSGPSPECQSGRGRRRPRLYHAQHLFRRQHDGGPGRDHRRSVWNYTFASAFSINPPTFDNGQVYVQRGDHSDVGGCELWSLNAATGAVTWSTPFDAQWERYYAPTVANGKIWVDGGYYGGLYGFDQASGSQLFFANEQQYDQWTPTYYNGEIYTWIAGVFSQQSPTTGAVNWSVNLGWNWSGWSMNTVSAIDNNRAFVVGTTGLFAVDLTTHAQLWGIAATGFSGSPAVVGNTVYAIHGTQVRAYDVATGTLEGTFDAGQGLIGQPIVTDNALIVASSARPSWCAAATSMCSTRSRPAAS